VSQQICQSCATANSTFASVCRSCSAPLPPRPLASEAPPGFGAYVSYGQSGPSVPTPTVAPASPPHTYEASPRSAPAEEGGWPAERLSVSSHQVWASNGWTGVPREQPRNPRPPVSPVWGPPPAPGPTRSDGRSATPPPAALAPTVPALPPAVPPPAPRAPMAFHLDVGAGSALAAAPHAPAPPSMPAPSSPPRPPAAATVVSTSSSTASLAAPDGGGRGWGVREQKPSLYPAWAPVAGRSGSGGGPSAGGAYAGIGLHTGYGHTAEPAALAPRVGRYRAVLRVFVLLVFVVLVAAGAFLYLKSR